MDSRCRPRCQAWPLLPLLLTAGLADCAVRPAPPATRHVIVDTDLGDDIDDAFALALAARSPSLRLDAVVTSLGDTALRARLARGLLSAAGRADVPVFAGPPTPAHTRFTQAAFASVQPTAVAGTDAVSAVLDRLRRAPAHSITLLGLAPMTTMGAMIARDPATVRRLAAVVMMGGSIRRGYPRASGQPSGADIEYNVASDPAGLRALLRSGVPVVVMPLDATLVPLTPAARDRLLSGGGALRDVLRVLFDQWHAGSAYPDRPTLFDVVPVAWLLRPSLCTPQPMRVEVDEAGRTRPGSGAPNALVCLHRDAAAAMSVLETALAGG